MEGLHISGILKSTVALHGPGAGTVAAEDTDNVDTDLTEWVSSDLEIGESSDVGTLAGVDGDFPKDLSCGN